GALTFRDIGERTKIAKTTLTGLIDRLEGKSLVKRENCTEDRRCTFVALTEEGQALYNSLYPERAAWVEKHFAALDSQELAECEGLLRRLRTTL
ncbi:MAG TPA: MarR family transcriptional regulator, partial [Gammaproteobacteria bacterium]|nr:MarR family transcriptional regulator [Gammaproteobacteria bacterium]